MLKIQNFLNWATPGFVAVLIGMTSSIALIYQMVINLGGDSAIVSSWLLVLGLAMGITSIGLSLYYKIPILIAWSTPGAALLITSTQGFNINEAIGAFIICAVFIFFSGISGIFERVINQIPQPIANAMLAGILVNFGIEVFNLFEHNLLIIASMLVSYLITKVFIPKFSMLIVLITGASFAYFGDLVDFSGFQWQMSQLNYIAPQFSMSAIISISVPLFIVTMASQNVPGVAVLYAHNYQPKISEIISITGFSNILIAPFGGYAINLAAITAAICMSTQVDKNKNKRYYATIFAGVFYIIMGLCAASLINIFDALPTAFILALAGIALFSTIASSLNQALSQPALSEATIITFLVTASDLVLFNIGSALWGIIAGVITLMVQKSANKSCSQ
ncbi:hypothetical protein CJF42_15060 [Pseudoalteromonas sp. NBT06-2]|uniref:benzoate/H(+) symporter BenE family transporter n=1 Tax=Pseudoalteromonas sp. NBT06-2 TaxID=2025950 RepID=UPI000BA75E12|nr:benzoate/H(+) symporter BenE family transporter [Pseudoalteromonas sp. NBT06-2]PAJ73582.1 hypothetical protein CJF42_15060 [Pseudoalteromonas sp. NBT06-2]